MNSRVIMSGQNGRKLSSSTFAWRNFNKISPMAFAECFFDQFCFNNRKLQFFYHDSFNYFDCFEVFRCQLAMSVFSDNCTGRVFTKRIYVSFCISLKTWSWAFEKLIKFFSIMARYSNIKLNWICIFFETANDMYNWEKNLIIYFPLVMYVSTVLNLIKL